MGTKLAGYRSRALSFSAEVAYNANQLIERRVLGTVLAGSIMAWKGYRFFICSGKEKAMKLLTANVFDLSVHEVLV